MKKTLQLERNIVVAAGTTKVVTLRLKEEYNRCTGFFVTPIAAGTDFSSLTIGLSIAQKEILPLGCDASLFALNDNISRKDATYDFTEENIPAHSSEVQLTLTNSDSNNAIAFNAYFVLNNI